MEREMGNVPLIKDVTRDVGWTCGWNACCRMCAMLCGRSTRTGVRGDRNGDAGAGDWRGGGNVHGGGSCAAADAAVPGSELAGADSSEMEKMRASAVKLIS